MNLTRREFVKVGLAALGATTVAPDLVGAEPDALPTVHWGGREISRLLLGHNPFKGIAHQAGDLGREMQEYFESVPTRGRDLMRRCEELGITTFQLGFRPSERLIEKMIRDRQAEGGRFQWIATFYSRPQDRAAAEQELRYLLRMNPPPIGVQQVGNTSDLLMRQGKLDLSLDNLKQFRDAGLLVGLGSHNAEVIDYVESKGWDLDFYQCCFYRSLFGLNPRPDSGESFEPADRDAMTRVIRRVSKPCIAFKVLAAGRHCQTPATLEAALRFTFQNIKPTDVVLLGMWQKHKDQAGENIALVRKILGNDQPVRPENLPEAAPLSPRPQSPQNKPFATFHRAQVAVRAERAAHSDQGVTVTILGGFYRLENRRAVWTRLIRNIPHR